MKLFVFELRFECFHFRFIFASHLGEAVEYLEEIEGEVDLEKWNVNEVPIEAGLVYTIEE